MLTETQISSTALQTLPIRQHIDTSKDSLFDVDHLIIRFSMRLQLNSIDDGGRSPDYDRSSSVILGNMRANSAVLVESLAELEIMRERYDRALGYYLAIGSRYMGDSLSLLEESAVRSVNTFHQSPTTVSTALSIKDPQIDVETDKYEHVLSLIELHQLYYILLKRNYFFVDFNDAAIESPIISLIRLVGLKRAGRFLMESCSPPEDVSVDVKENTLISKDRTTNNSANLPLDLLANQLKSTPKFLYWFLFQIFIHKPDIYVKFPTTAVPPLAITDLHRIQFSLFVDYADGNEADLSIDSSAFLSADSETPFMSFLKVRPSQV